MELTSDPKASTEKTTEDREVKVVDSETDYVGIEKDVNDVVPQKKSMLPKVIIGVLIAAIVLVGVLLTVRYFNQSSMDPTQVTDLPAGVSPGEIIIVSEDKNGNITTTDGSGNPIDMEGFEMNEDGGTENRSFSYSSGDEDLGDK